jgi:hypothetical protein
MDRNEFDIFEQIELGIEKYKLLGKAMLTETLIVELVLR